MLRSQKLFYYIIIFVITVFTFLFLLLNSRTDTVQLYSFDDDDDGTADNNTCSVPKMNPWDPTILKFIAHPKDLACKQVQMNLTFIDYAGTLRYNESELKTLNQGNISFSCLYRTFERCNADNDSCISYSNERILIEPIRLDKDFVDIKCMYDNKTQFYRNIHAHPAETMDRIFANTTDNQLSVLLLVIDSTSYSALQRNMPLTYDYTKNVMGIKYFEAYNKVGDNSIPNMLAMLTGKRMFDEQEGMLREIDHDYGKVKHDGLPLIWKLFSSKGYSTCHNQDMPVWGLFNMESNGFIKKPVDYFYHSFWLAIMDAEDKINHSEHCFANYPRPTILLDTTKRQIIRMSNANKLQFLYSHSSESTHDHANEVERLDLPFKEFFKGLYEGNYLNKTMIIFAADHGHRFSDIRSTLVGLLEERLPFYGLWFPSWFYKLHPHIERNIDANKKIMSSTFDAYETMIDVLNTNYEGKQRSVNSRGQSQLYLLPTNRTCKSAGIPDHYCTCIKQQELNISHNAVFDSASSLITNLNEKLKNLTEYCHQIKLKEILYATKIDFDDKVKKGINKPHALKEYNDKMKYSKKDYNMTRIQIGIKTEPFDATFEATLQLIKKENGISWILDGGISRTNSYAGLSDCIKDKILQKYCSCLNIKLDLNSTFIQNNEIS